MSEESEQVDENDLRARLKKAGTRTEIMIIDGDVEQRMVTRHAIETCDYKVIELESAQQAERMLQAKHWNWSPQAIILDLILPGGSGYQLIHTLRQRFDDSKKVPIVVVSKMSAEADILEAQSAGADAFVVKPYSPQGLLEAVLFSVENQRKSLQERKVGIHIVKPAIRNPYSR